MPRVLKKALKAARRRFRDSLPYAYAQGCWERARWGDGYGRTHETNASWSDAYDYGANLADRLMFWRAV
ncbi:hypothetical protein [Halomonas sp. E19]|uniref:hypothetical protein n=1 Tax=Halomonas sp. E19 TaxID=3397247 RepID=UPI004034B02B